MGKARIVPKQPTTTTHQHLLHFSQRFLCEVVLQVANHDAGQGDDEQQVEHEKQACALLLG